jgi:hypothetical protein
LRPSIGNAKTRSPSLKGDAKDAETKVLAGEPGEAIGV